MSLSITVEVEKNMGDHGEYRRIAIPYVEGESVEDLIRRAGKQEQGYRVDELSPLSVVEIRRVNTE